MSKTGASPQEEQKPGPAAESSAASSASSVLAPQAELIEQIPYVETPKKARNRTKHELLDAEHEEREHIAAQVIQAIKIKLGAKEASSDNVKAIIIAWRDEILTVKKMAGGHKLEPVSKDVAKEGKFAEIKSPLLLAFLTHATRVPSAIAYEVRFLGISDKSTQSEAEQAGKMANQAWMAIEAERMKRLQEIDKQLAANVQSWQKDVPACLTDEQIKERDRLREFKPEREEERQSREAAIARVNGFPAIVERNRQAAVSRATEKRLKQSKQKLVRQMAEHPEEERELMQLRYGVLPISASRQEGVLFKAAGKLGIGCWQNDFETDPEKLYEDYHYKDAKPHRAVLDHDQKGVTWPERKQQTQAIATVQMPKRVYAQSKVKEDPSLTILYKARLERDKSKFKAQESKDLMELDSKAEVDALAASLKRVLVIK